MRRPFVRALIPAALAVALAVPTASMASATPPATLPRLTGAFAAHLPARLRGVLDRPRPARAFHSEGFGGQFRVAGSPYVWIVEVTRVAQHWSLQIEGERTYTNGDQFHAWQFSLPLGDAALGPALMQAHVRTGSALGPFGRIDLTYHSARRIRRRIARCPKTHAVLYSAAERRGTLRGSLEFTPNEGTLPDLSLTMVHASAGRFSASGAHCPGSNGRPHCDVQTGVSLADPSQQVFAGGSISGPYQGANHEFSAFIERHVGPAWEFHGIDAEAFTPPVRLRAPGVTIDASMLGPFFSGSLSFESGATTHRRGAHCKIASTVETWASGTVTAAFDSGAVDLTGGGLRARVIALTRP